MKPFTIKQSLFFNFLIAPRYRILRHSCLVFALIFVTINYISPYAEQDIFEPHILAFFLLGILASFLLVAYFTIYFLIPRFLLKKKYLSFISFLSLTILVLLTLQYFGEIAFCHFLDIPAYTTYRLDNKLILILDISANFFINLITFTGGSVTILLRSWLTTTQEAAQLEKRHLQNEVEHLKEQINPGFMFQTLHHAGTLEKTNPAQASDILMKLSRLLRYQLYDCNHKLVFFPSEIRYIENYLSLEKTYTPQLSYNITTVDEINTILVPPLLIIPFVQFMTGILKTGNTPGVLDIRFSCVDEDVVFICTLTPRETVQNKMILKIPELERVIKRLRILTHNRYTLEFYGKDSLHIHSMYLKFNTEAE